MCLGKYHVDAYIKEVGLLACFLHTGNLYENMILHQHVRYTKRHKSLSSGSQLSRKTRNFCSLPALLGEYINILIVAILYVQKDLSAVTKAVFDYWDFKKTNLNHEYLYVANARVSPRDIVACIERGMIINPNPLISRLLIREVTSKECTYTVPPTTRVPDQDIMFQLYNEKGMYGTKAIPDPNILALGVELHGIQEFVRECLIPFLGI